MKWEGLDSNYKSFDQINRGDESVIVVTCLLRNILKWALLRKQKTKKTNVGFF
jgi:hypothetical protein